jgi:excinuclease UvrABC nuclease subunit
METGTMVEIAIPEDPVEFDRLLEALPNRQAVFLLWPRQGKPYLARTNVLRKRLTRLLGTRESPSRSLNLRGTVERIEYQFTGSRLGAQFLVLDLAKRFLGAGYRNDIRLRLPPYVKLILTNQFPRTQVTTHLGRARAVYFGPFRNRSTAARFESEFLDLFQLRRCQEDLVPRPGHPGCIYGEMGRCLRPCQQAVGVEEYAGEAGRVAEFLKTGGKSLALPAESARERLSAEMDFEGAALMHQRHQRIEAVLALRDEMARDIDRLNAIAIIPAPDPDAVELGWLREGAWQGFSRIEFSPADGTSVSLDARLRELALAAPSHPAGGVERMEQLAVVARWFYSSWCDGELLMVDDWSKIPYRKLVNAVSRIAHAPASHRPSTHS